jgi:hypothetical protein
MGWPLTKVVANWTGVPWRIPRRHAGWTASSAEDELMDSGVCGSGTNRVHGSEKREDRLKQRECGRLQAPARVAPSNRATAKSAHHSHQKSLSTIGVSVAGNDWRLWHASLDTQDCEAERRIVAGQRCRKFAQKRPLCREKWRFAPLRNAVNYKYQKTYRQTHLICRKLFPFSLPFRPKRDTRLMQLPA